MDKRTLLILDLKSEKEIDELGYVLNSLTIMSKIKRYYFFKRLYNDYLIIFYENSRYSAFFYDKLILEEIGFNCQLKIIDNYKINYIIVTNLELINEVIFDINKYNHYYMIVMAKGIVKYINNKL